MAESISVQSGYLLVGETVEEGKLPLMFRINNDGKLELEGKIVFPKTLGGVKINTTAKPEDPNQWDFGEIEVKLEKNINSIDSAEIFFTGFQDTLTLNIKVPVNCKKVWNMGADSKVWNM